MLADITANGFITLAMITVTAWIDAPALLHTVVPLLLRVPLAIHIKLKMVPFFVRVLPGINVWLNIVNYKLIAPAGGSMIPNRLDAITETDLLNLGGQDHRVQAGGARRPGRRQEGVPGRRVLVCENGTKAEQLKNVDIAVKLVPKEPDPQRNEKLTRQRADEAANRGKRFPSFAARKRYAEDEVRAFLKQKSRGIALYDLDAAIEAGPARVVWERKG